MSPTQRTLAELRGLGRRCGIVERFNPYGGPHGVRQDLFGFIDIICIDPVKGIVAIQSCGTDWSGHVHKLLEERHEEVADWLQFNPIELWAWRRVKKKRGGRQMIYRPRIGDLVFDNGNIKVVERKI